MSSAKALGEVPAPSAYDALLTLDQSILEAMPAPVYVCSAEGGIVRFNRRATELWGRSQRPGDSHDRFCGSFRLYLPDGQSLPHDSHPMAEALRTGEPQRDRELVIERADGSRAVALANIELLKDAFGRIQGAVGSFQEIGGRQPAEDLGHLESLARRMAEQSALYAFTDRLHRAESLTDVYGAAFDTILRALRCERAAIFLFDGSVAMRFVAWRGLSDEYRRAVDGHSPWTHDTKDPRPVCIDDIDSAALPEPLRATVRAEGIRALAFIPIVANGKLIGKLMAYYKDPHVFADDELGLALTIARQLGFGIERRRAEEQRDLLVAELSHRVKNTLATVISIARQSFSKSQDIDKALRSFNARIRALAQTHGRLAEANWSGVPLESILLDELAPYRRDDGANVRISGPSITLNPRCAVTLGMAIHELATNAAKYGALSTKGGSVNVAWQMDSEDGQLRIRWTEAGGPAIAAPGPGGFGRLLLERALAADLQGNVQLDFASDGLKCRIDLPLDEHLVRSNWDRAHS